MGCGVKAQISVEAIFVISFLLLVFGFLMVDYNFRLKVLNNEEIIVSEEDLCKGLAQRIANVLLSNNTKTTIILPKKINGVNYAITINGSEKVIILSDDKNNNIFCGIITTEVYDSTNNNEFLIPKTTINLTNIDSKVVFLW